MSERSVGSYGLHSNEGVQWLVQGRGATNFVGLKGESPFRPPRFACNHLVPGAAPIPDKSHWDLFRELSEFETVRRFFPIPQTQGRATFIEVTGNQIDYWATTLSRLSSPIRPIVRPAWMFKAQDLPREMITSNIQPLIITGIRHSHNTLVSAAAELAMSSPRHVILIGDDSVVLRPNIDRFGECRSAVNLEQLMVLPMENIGAFLLRRFARGEELMAPMETRDERRNRLIRERNGTTTGIPGR